MFLAVPGTSRDERMQADVEARHDPVDDGMALCPVNGFDARVPVVRLTGMHGRSHYIARWLRLMLACLALVGSFAPAHATPDANPVAAVSVLRRESARPRPAVAPAGRFAPTGEGSWGPRLHLVGRVPEVLLPGPPRRLFIVHRALLH